MTALVTTPSVPFRADHEMEQVVAGAALDELAAEGQDIAGRGDDLEAADVIAEDAVLDRPASAGVRGDHPADHGAFLARMGREIESGLLDRVLELAERHARLDDGHQVDGVDLEDAVHPLDREDDRAGRRDDAAAQAGGAAARDDGQAKVVGQLEDRRDLGRRRGLQDEFGNAADLAERELVVAVVLELLRIGDEVVAADDGRERIDVLEGRPLVHGKRVLTYFKKMVKWLRDRPKSTWEPPACSPPKRGPPSRCSLERSLRPNSESPISTSGARRRS